jgi:hypothetical protein
VASADALWALWFNDPSYEDKLAEVVPEVARRAHVNPRVLSLVWAQTDRRRMIVLLSALTQVGVPYRHYTMEVGKGFDCSGLTSWAWHQVGVELPKQSLRQIRMVPSIAPEVAQPGDLLYYPGHIMIAIGVGGAIVHAPYTGRTVEVRPMVKYRAKWVRAGAPV